MSPQLISSYYRRDSEERQSMPYRGDDGTRLLERTGTVYTYHGRTVTEDDPYGSAYEEREDDDLLFAMPKGSIEGDPPPSTQPRPPTWNDPDGFWADNAPVEVTSMEHFICFVHRGTAFWFRVSITIDEPALGDRLHPRVTVRLVDPPGRRDRVMFPAGVVIERRMQDGLRWEIEEALQQPAVSPVFRSSSLY